MSSSLQSWATSMLHGGPEDPFCPTEFSVVRPLSFNFERQVVKPYGGGALLVPICHLHSLCVWCVALSVEKVLIFCHDMQHPFRVCSTEIPLFSQILSTILRKNFPTWPHSQARRAPGISWSKGSSSTQNQAEASRPAESCLCVADRVYDPKAAVSAGRHVSVHLVPQGANWVPVCISFLFLSCAVHSAEKRCTKSLHTVCMVCSVQCMVHSHAHTFGVLW